MVFACKIRHLCFKVLGMKAKCITLKPNYIVATIKLQMLHAKLQKKSISIFYKETISLLPNSKNPVYRWTITMILLKSFMRRINVFIKNSELYTDDGWFYSAKQIQTNFFRDTWNTDSVSRSGDDPLFQILFYSSHDSLESIRRYQSISEALASVSGMGNFLFLFFSLFIYVHTYLKNMNITLNSLLFSKLWS